MGVLRQAWKKWRAFGKVMADFVARIFMTVFYFTIAVPFGIGVRLFKDPLRLKSKQAGWLPREEREESVAAARRLF